MQRKNTWTRMSLMVMLSLIIAACGTATAPTTESPAASLSGSASPPVSTSASASATSSASASGSAQAPVGTLGVAGSTDPATFGLQAGKPYDGTKLRFLSCCSTSAQFASLILRTQSEFTPMTGIEVTWDDTPYATFQEKLQTEASSGSDQYDVIMWVDSWGHGLKPFLAPLDDRIAEAGIDMADFPQAYVDASKGEDGKIYGLPLRGHAQVLFYRKDVLEQAGVEPPTTWQELVASAPAIKETGIDPISLYYGVNGGQNLFIWLNMLWGNGSDIFDAEYRPTFNNEAGVEATQLYVDLLRNQLTAPGSVTFNEQDANLEMLQGRAAMFVGWWWMYSNFKNPETTSPQVADNVGFVPAPGWEGGQPISYGYIWPTGILQASQNQDAAWEYLKWMTSTATEKQVAIDKTDPKLDNIVVVHKTNLNDPEINATTGGLQEAGGKILETARTQPLIAEWPEVQTVLEVAINEMANGAPVKERLDQAAQEVEEIMERSGRY